jgi:hypothetical protein
VDAREIEAFAPSLDERLAAHERPHHSLEHLLDTPEPDESRPAHDRSLSAGRRSPEAGAHSSPRAGQKPRLTWRPGRDEPIHRQAEQLVGPAGRMSNRAVPGKGTR